MLFKSSLSLINPLWNRNEHARKQRELGCGFTLYGWDGDNLAWESSPAQSDYANIYKNIDDIEDETLLNWWLDS